MLFQFPSITVTYTHHMDISLLSSKQVGALGEKLACEYLRRHGMKILARNVTRKTGEIDVVARKTESLHFVEVKTIICVQFAEDGDDADRYDPSSNIHEAKIRRIARTSEWYVANVDWEGEWQLDAVLVWLRRRDGMAKVRYLPQIL